MKAAKISAYLIGFIFILDLLSCGTSRKINFFDDLKDQQTYRVPKTVVVDTIKKGDLLYIYVNSADVLGSANFNNVLAGSIQTDVLQLNGYLVDENGQINFPVLGLIDASGKTKSKLKNELGKSLEAYLKDPVVTIRQLNFSVTVIGEVMKPGSYRKVDERMTLLDAIGEAGGITEFGNLERVMLIRENEKAQQYHRIDMTNRASVAQEFFYLQANDVIYVEPRSSKKFRTSQMATLIPAIITAAALVLVNTIFK
ncbi:polysaccharide biosynthesis/export family protein [Pedobacter sp. KLB.chiD]|uniref:polysaccharide biosynthesis/export family protein n=1 Tax=Pedobacter sp. KLB.chiD TaxID=3387402 RepID=UPI00399BCE59